MTLNTRSRELAGNDEIPVAWPSSEAKRNDQAGCMAEQ
jgi:hypothetical protein